MKETKKKEEHKKTKDKNINRKGGRKGEKQYREVLKSTIFWGTKRPKKCTCFDRGKHGSSKETVPQPLPSPPSLLQSGKRPVL
jgi:hypothetical protein